ncbi:MAG: transglutaminase-like domain-containing protein [Nocardioidaceae bacterium]
MTTTAPAPPAPPAVAPPAPADQAVVPARPVLPDREGWADAAFVLLLGTAALLGLAPTFTGSQFFVVGLGGLLLGVAAGLVATTRRWPLAAPVLVAALLLFLLGGPLCLRSEGAWWPVPHTWGLLADQLLFGWKDLLTTLPPVDGDGPLLALPWALGLLTGSAAMALARLRVGPRWLRIGAPLPVPMALLAFVILLGLHRPQDILVQGVLFSVGLLAWLVVRGQRTTVDVAGSTGRLGRLAVGASLLVLAAAASVPVALLSDSADAQRVVLRDSVEPPFDIGRYPSPLASFRRYVQVPQDPPPENLYARELFTVSGVEPGTRVRMATLDSYDGKVWGASDNAIPGAVDDTYRRVSSTIDNPVDGDRVTVDVTIDDGYSGVWLPVVGALQSTRFDGDLETEADGFRYNLATSTGVMPSGLQPGDHYSFTAVLPDDELTEGMDAGGSVGPAGDAAAFLGAQAQEWAGDLKSPMKRVLAIADHLRTEGKYTDGVATAEQIYHAGHFQGRLAEFVNAPIIAGNDEQYAATMALLANRAGVPARVVMGAVVPADGVVHGSDVSAWVEVQTSDGSWRTLPTERFMGTDRPAKLPPESQQSMGGTNVPPPAPIPPPTSTGEQADVKVKANKLEADDDEPALGAGLPAWVRAVLLYGGVPLLALGLLLGAVVLAKVVRRRVRRRAARASARVVGGWRELVDHARDLGHPVPAAAVVTRREQSRHMVSESAPALARRADAHVFGPEPPEIEAADSFWAAVNAERRAMSAAVARRRRLLGAVSLRTFRRAR